MRLEAKWEYPAVTGRTATLNHLLLKLITPPDHEDIRRRPIATVLVLDKSWSMKGTKLEEMIAAAGSFINWLTRKDYVGIVAYASDVQVLQPLTQLTEKTSIANRLQAINLGTSTNLSGGWLQGLKMLQQSTELDNALKRVILLTDGLATVGIQDEESLVNIAKQHANDNITTTTIGLGNDFNESTLSWIARAGRGNFYFIDSPEKTSDIFFKEFGEMGSLYAQATDVTITFPKNVVFHELLQDVPYTEEADRLHIQMDDMRTDDTYHLITGVEIQPAEDPQPLDLKVEVSYYNAQKEMKKESRESVGRLEIGESEPDAEVETEVLIALAGKTMIQASNMAEDDLEGANQVLENMKSRLADRKALSPGVFGLLIKRMEDLREKLREDSRLARKQAMSTRIEATSDRAELGFKSNIQYHDDIYEYSWQGDLDMYNAPELKQTIRNQILEGFRNIVIDLSQTPYIDSSAIGTLIQISNWVTRRGGLLVVANLSSTLEKLFQQTRLDTYIPVAESVTGAHMMIEGRLKNRDNH